MITITVSTTGWGLRPYGGKAETPECHKVEDIRYSRFCGATEYDGPGADRNVAVLQLTIAEALDLIDDLRSQIRYTEVAA